MTLLWLQEHALLNVNLILLLMYLQTKDVFISINKFKRLSKNNKNLDSLTSNFREKRKVMKVDNIANGIVDHRTREYQELLRLELDLEKQQQAKLIDMVLEFSKHYDLDAKSNGCAGIDIKYYLGTLAVGIESALVIKSQKLISELIKEQKILATTFGKYPNE